MAAAWCTAPASSLSPRSPSLSPRSLALSLCPSGRLKLSLQKGWRSRTNPRSSPSCCQTSDLLQVPLSKHPFNRLTSDLRSEQASPAVHVAEEEEGRKKCAEEKPKNTVPESTSNLLLLSRRRRRLEATQSAKRESSRPSPPKFSPALRSRAGEGLHAPMASVLGNSSRASGAQGGQVKCKLKRRRRRRSKRKEVVRNLGGGTGAHRRSSPCVRCRFSPSQLRAPGAAAARIQI
ncbi:unnamed protein product [Pleuronectes platessa]|uniref:Uncharacterized protein n=1 Tax=Pleuronectes platessa TaxID=8262 RepID=A0A9N7VI54_PLEPL|nr:unnamed protein product [Pleuronectes platessa]